MINKHQLFLPLGFLISSLVLLNSPQLLSQCDNISTISNVTTGPLEISCDGSTFVWDGLDVLGFEVYSNESPNVPISSGSTDSFSPQISCDGSNIVWHGADAAGVFQIYSNENPNLPISSGSADSFNPQISCNGNTIVWQGTDATGISQIFSNNNPNLPISNGSSDNRSPQISCDGTTIVWNGRDANGVLQIYSNANPNVPISSGSTFNSNPALSCDGSTIVWNGTDAAGQRQIYSNSNPNVPISSGSDFNFSPPQVSCDGNTIVWSGRFIVSESHIFTNANPNVPISSGTSNQSPQISCDGSTIVWISGGDQISSFRNCCQIQNIQIGTPVVNEDDTYSVSLSYEGNDPNIVINGGTGASPATAIANGIRDCNDNDPCTETARMLTFTYPCTQDATITFGGDCGFGPFTIAAPADCISPNIPTMSQWGLLIFGLLVLNLSVIFIGQIELIYRH